MTIAGLRTCDRLRGCGGSHVRAGLWLVQVTNCGRNESAVKRCEAPVAYYFSSPTTCRSEKKESYYRLMYPQGVRFQQFLLHVAARKKGPRYMLMYAR